VGGKAKKNWEKGKIWGETEKQSAGPVANKRRDMCLFSKRRDTRLSCNLGRRLQESLRHITGG